MFTSSLFYTEDKKCRRKSLPTYFDCTESTTQILRTALCEYIQEMENRLDDSPCSRTQGSDPLIQQQVAILRMYYFEHLTKPQIAEALQCSPRNVTIMQACFFAQFLSGEILPMQLQLKKAVRLRIQGLQKQLYKPYKHVVCDLPILHAIGLDILKVGTTNILIPFGKQKVYQQVLSAVIETLQLNIEPVKIKTLYYDVHEHWKLEDGRFNPLILKTLLTCNSLVDKFYGRRVRIKDEYVKDEAQRCARIIFDSGGGLSTDEVLRRYEEKYGKRPRVDLEMSSFYHIYCLSNRYWFYTHCNMSLKKNVFQFAEGCQVFRLEDLESVLRFEGYRFLKFRRWMLPRYLKQVCLTSPTDPGLYVFKEYAKAHPEALTPKAG